MAEPDDLERGIFPDRDKIPDLDAAEDQGNLMGDDEDPDYSGNLPTRDDTDLLDLDLEKLDRGFPKEPSEPS